MPVKKKYCTIGVFSTIVGYIFIIKHVILMLVSSVPFSQKNHCGLFLNAILSSSKMPFFLLFSVSIYSHAFSYSHFPFQCKSEKHRILKKNTCDKRKSIALQNMFAQSDRRNDDSLRGPYNIALLVAKIWKANIGENHYWSNIALHNHNSNEKKPSNQPAICSTRQ